MAGTSGRTYDPIDLSSRAFWSTTADDRERSFAVLRAERPVSWHPPAEDAMMPDPEDRGYWAVTRRADIVTVSRNNDVFSSGKGVMFENFPEELLEASQSFLAMDPPRHTKLRKLAHAAFTPRQVRRIEESINANAKTIVAELRAAGSGGLHFCLGAHVARSRLRAVFGELLRQVPDIEAGGPTFVTGNFIHAIGKMPCSF